MRYFKVFREKVSLKQSEVASVLGVSNTTVSMWETGSAKPRAELLPKIAALYGCTTDDLLGVGGDVAESA